MLKNEFQVTKDCLLKRLDIYLEKITAIVPADKKEQVKIHPNNMQAKIPGIEARFDKLESIQKQMEVISGLHKIINNIDDLIKKMDANHYKEACEEAARRGNSRMLNRIIFEEKKINPADEKLWLSGLAYLALVNGHKPVLELLVPHIDIDYCIDGKTLLAISENMPDRKEISELLKKNGARAIYVYEAIAKSPAVRPLDDMDDLLESQMPLSTSHRRRLR